MYWVVEEKGVYIVAARGWWGARLLHSTNPVSLRTCWLAPKGRGGKLAAGDSSHSPRKQGCHLVQHVTTEAKRKGWATGEATEKPQVLSLVFLGRSRDQMWSLLFTTIKDPSANFRNLLRWICYICIVQAPRLFDCGLKWPKPWHRRQFWQSLGRLLRYLSNCFSIVHLKVRNYGILTLVETIRSLLLLLHF